MFEMTFLLSKGTSLQNTEHRTLFSAAPLLAKSTRVLLPILLPYYILVYTLIASPLQGISTKLHITRVFSQGASIAIFPVPCFRPDPGSGPMAVGSAKPVAMAA